MESEYPKREQFFAHKFVRLLTKSCAAQDIGLNAFSLLCVIVHQEDSARYCGPVRFWNEQLMSTLSLSPRALREARDKAIKFGWLVYFRENDRATGRYFVTIPKKFSGLSDAPIEEPCAVRGEVPGEVSGADLHMEVHKEVTSNCTRSEHESAPEPSPPSIPIPNPVPSIYTPGRDVIIPERINTEQFREIIWRWIEYTRLPSNEANAIETNSMEEQELWRLVAAWKVDADSLSAAVSAAIMGRWANLRKPPGTRFEKANHQKSRYSDDLMTTLKVCRSHPGRDSWQEREKNLTAEQIQALKRAGGSAALLEAAGNDWNLQTFSEIYEAHLKEIRNGITASN